MKTVGEAWLEEKTWCIRTQPHVARRIRALFQVSTQFGTVEVPATPSNSEDLAWIFSRYPMGMKDEDREALEAEARKSIESRERADEIAESPNALPYGFDLAVPLREYQKTFVAIAQVRKRILNGDDVGLGKTAQAIGVLAFLKARPAIVVCQTHLQTQWVDQVSMFAPLLSCHIIKTAPRTVRGGEVKEYRLPDCDVFVITYSKIASWTDRLSRFARTIVFDEAQELRRFDSKKYRAAKHISEKCEYAIGLSATPVYNYGDEAFNVLDAIHPGQLGRRGEFVKEWCSDWGSHVVVDDPPALGAYLREQHLLLRRTRKEVGRELPEVNKIIQPVSYEASVLEALKKDGLVLARTILEGTFTEKGQAARELDNRLRQATGIAKAGAVGEFVAELNAEQPTKVLLGAWHREVYTVIQDKLDERKIGSVLYTGSESPTQKNRNFEQFRDDPDCRVMLISNRSGVGLDGLQEISNVVVFAELDWSDKVHDQIIGRLRRDGQRSQVTAFFLIASVGSDPIICSILGLKNTQSEGIMNLTDSESELLASTQGETEGDNLSRMKQLAKAYLEQ